MPFRWLGVRDYGKRPCVVANANDTYSTTIDWALVVEMDPMKLADNARESFISRIVADAKSHYSPESSMRERPVRAVLRVVVSSAGFRLTLLYRIGYACRYRNGFFGTVISRCCFWIGTLIYKCSIAGTANIGGGLVLPHPIGIVIGPGVAIGARTWIFQHVTIGGSPVKQGMPQIGSDARIYSGAVIAGPCEIGDHVTIGANVVVSDSIEDYALVLPGRPVVRLRSN
ncbi:serine O-acetyltransferase [Novipirellula sp. SH528]|uniref:serine O-acetyltransferase n=1 Tax=Novipirellula sp. SH528 TaxID=3454466 RepID=UPI003FA0F626